MLLLVILLSMLLSLLSCSTRYSGEHVGAYTVANNSLLWIRGFSTQTDFFCDPKITILETDSYGRVLFRYTENYTISDDAFSSLLILQCDKDGFVYYYEDFNFISKEKVFDEKWKCYNDQYEAEFASEEILKLKEKNDWDQPLNLEKCIKKPHEIERRQTTIISGRYHPDDFPDYFDRIYDNSYTRFLTSDDYGRTIYFAFARDEESDQQYEKTYLIILYQPDMSYSVFSPSSIYDYQNELQQFKAENGWNCPPEA